MKNKQLIKNTQVKGYESLTNKVQFISSSNKENERELGI